MASSKAKLGNNWTYKIYFDPEADNHTGASYEMKDDDLIAKLTYLVGGDENINKVSAYKHPLRRIQFTDFILHHMFIIFETHSWWWSIEKNASGITIQRSKNKTAVLYRCRQTNQLSRIKKVMTDKGRFSVFELINWLYESNGLNNEYNVLRRNCQHFAKAVFDYVAKEKYLQIATWMTQDSKATEIIRWFGNSDKRYIPMITKRCLDKCPT